VATTTVSLNNRTDSFPEQVGVITGEDIAVERQPILHVTIEKESGSRTFTVPITLEAGLSGQPEPQTLTVTLKGPIPSLAALKPSDITVTLIGSGTGKGQSLVPQIRISG